MRRAKSPSTRMPTSHCTNAIPAVTRNTGNGQRERHSSGIANATSKATPPRPSCRGVSSGSTSSNTTAALMASQRRGRKRPSTLPRLRVAALHQERRDQERQKGVSAEQGEAAPRRERVRLVHAGQDRRARIRRQVRIDRVLGAGREDRRQSGDDEQQAGEQRDPARGV